MAAHSIRCPRCGEISTLTFTLREVQGGTLVDVDFLCRSPQEANSTSPRDVGPEGGLVLTTNITWPGIFVDAGGNLLFKAEGMGGAGVVGDGATAVVDLDEGPDEEECHAPGAVDLCDSDDDNAIDVCSDVETDTLPPKSSPWLSPQSSTEEVSPRYAVGVTYYSGGDLDDDDFDCAEEASESSMGSHNPDLTTSYNSTEESDDCVCVHVAHLLD